MPARPSPLIQNVHGRAVRDLGGPWRAIVDPYQNGSLDYRGQPHTAEGYFADRKPASPSDRIEYDFDRSRVAARPRRLELAAPRAVPVRGDDLVPDPLPGCARPGPALVPPLRRRQLPGARPSERHRWSASTAAASPRSMSRSPPGCAPGENSLVVQVDDTRRRGGGPGPPDRLVELRRADPRRAAGRPARARSSATTRSSSTRSARAGSAAGSSSTVPRPGRARSSRSPRPGSRPR